MYTFCIPTAAYYLLHFGLDETVSVVSASATCISEVKVEVGGYSYVREKGKLYKGRIITYSE